MGRVKLYDVVVIGGGPAGSQVAYRLAGMGYGVVVLEQKASLGEPVCCTGIISQECVDSFAIEDSVIFRGVNSARIFSPSGKRLDLRRPETQACIVDRPAFNMALARRAQSKGAEYVLHGKVGGVEVCDRKVVVKVSFQGEEEGIFEARAAVVANGFGPKTVEEMGLGKVGDFVMGAQTQVAAAGIDEVEVYLGEEIAPGFFAWLVPTSPGMALVGLLSRRRPGQYLRQLMLSLKAQGKIGAMEAELSYGGIPLKPLARTYANRLLVVGGAAGQVKPTTGGGIYFGLLGADIAAGCLHQKLKRDTLSAADMAAYERRWQKVLGRELRTGYRARKLYERLNNRQIDRIFDIIKVNAIDEALLKADDLSFDWHGAVVLRLIGHQALTRAFKVMKLPFKLGGRG